MTRETTPAELKRNYYRIARALHPDNYGADITSTERRRRQRRFQRVAEAYEVLTSEPKRRAYDAGAHDAGELSQRRTIHEARKKASYDSPPGFQGDGGVISDEEMRRLLSDEQWREYTM